jgi:SAM-dependent methyltransferase
MDLRYGRVLSGSVPTRYAHLGAHSTENSSYSSLDVMFEGRIRPDDVLVDIGCGKGRVINWWLSQGLCNRMVGIELDEQIAQQTRRRLRQFANVEIINGNAVSLIPEDATLLYLYNPFDADVMRSLKCRLKNILIQTNKTKITVVYFNCKHLDVFGCDPQCSIQMGEAIYPFAIIEIGSHSK